MTDYPVIAIDGPSASGKSTLAKALARRLKFDYLDTGAMYRALAWKVLEQKINLKDRKEIISLCRGQRIKFTKSGRRFRIFINGRDVSGKIRIAEVGEAASILSKIKEVRRVMTRTQRRLAKKRKVILEGRDIGTVVFPEADCKIFLDASLEERAGRRHKEFLEKGRKLGRATLKKDLMRRDNRDSRRKAAPLRKSRDAVLLDSTDLTISDMLREALVIVAKKIK